MKYRVKLTKEIVLDVDGQSEAEALAAALTSPILTLPMEWSFTDPIPLEPVVEKPQEYSYRPPGMDDDIYEDEG